MSYPYTRQRTRGRTRPSTTQPFAAAPATIVSVTHGTNVATVVFSQSMDTSLLGPPAGWTVAGNPVTAVNSWTNSTTAVVAVATSIATDPYVFPSTSVLRTAAGGPVASASGVAA